MLDAFLQNILLILDWLFESIVSPVFLLAGRGLELLMLKPLDALHAPVVWQLILAAVITALLSRYLRTLFRVEQKEQEFKEKFSAEKAKQQDIKLLEDWKTRDEFYKACDQELDEDFNTYLAQRIGRYVGVYLLPLFLVLFWLNSVFSTQELLSRNGSPFVVSLSGWSLGIEGLNVTFVFLVAYVFSLTFLHFARKLNFPMGLKRSSHCCRNI